MPMSTLSRMTVPVDGDSTGEGLYHPKLKYRFRVVFENFGNGSPTTELTKQVINCARPSLDHDHIELHTYNSRINIVGKHAWQPINIEIRDDAGGSVQKALGEQLQRQFDHNNQASPAAGQDYKFITTLEILDGGNGAHAPTSLETWSILGCYVQSSNFNQLDYTASDVATVSLTLRYDNAIHLPFTSGIGADVGRKGGTLATGMNGLNSGDSVDIPFDIPFDIDDASLRPSPGRYSNYV